MRDVVFRVRGSDGEVTLLDDISLSLSPGQVLAVVGPNGAGKSTLVRLIAGLQQPNRGTVSLDGQALQKLTAAERAKRIAYVGQVDEPDGRLTVSQYIHLGRLPHEGFLGPGSASAEAVEAIRVAGLQSIAHRRLEGLSGGERQKAKIARALCQRPSLLVLDEPTNHLDPSARGDLLGLVAEMGVSVVVALHDLTLIDTLADTVAVLSSGKLVAFGAPAKALSSDQVRRVFRVDLHRFSHPTDERCVPALDIALDHRLAAHAASAEQPPGE
ncbi:MAG: ABC transporter ATP-binding protein [Pseudomonadota bacterium]